MEKNIETLGRLLLQIGIDHLNDKQLLRLVTIYEVARQQRKHYEDSRASISNRIVNLRQPHVRPIVRGKAGRDMEFGQKLALSVVEGYVFIEEQSWTNFAEGVTLQASVEKCRQWHGVYPEAVIADKTYRSRENIRFCKEHGIHLSEPRLGRSKANISADMEDKVQVYIDNCERNMIEDRIGLTKRRYD